MFKKIEINIPFAEALVQMPNHAKFLKDILSKKCNTQNYILIVYYSLKV